MTSQITCKRTCIVALAAFVWFFPTVHFQMCPQTVCPRRGIVTLVAFVWLFSTVGFQMCPQTVCPRGCKVTLIAFVSSVRSSSGYHGLSHTRGKPLFQIFKILQIRKWKWKWKWKDPTCAIFLKKHGIQGYQIWHSRVSNVKHTNTEIHLHITFTHYISSTFM